MVHIGTDLLELNVVPSADFLRNLLDGERDLISEKSFTVLNRKDDVVMGVKNIVDGPTKAHAPILMRKPRVFPLSYKELRGRAAR